MDWPFSRQVLSRLTVCSARVMVSLLVGFLGGCSGGGSSSGDGTNGVSGLSDVSGYAVFRTPYGTRVVSLTDGTNRMLDVRLDVWPSFDASEWAGFDTKRRNSDGEDDLHFFDSSGALRLVSAVNRSVHGTAKISPDKKSVAIFWSDQANGESFSFPTLTLFDRERGRVINRIAGAVSFDWMPSGDFAYSDSNRIYIGDRLGRSPRLVRQVSGSIDHLAVSRDGQRLAFSVQAEPAAKSNIWVVNSDGTELKQVTTSQFGDRDPVWIDQNRKLLVRRSGLASCSNIFVVDTQTPSPVELLDAGNAYSKMVKHFDLEGTPTSLVAACPLSPPAWCGLECQ